MNRSIITVFFLTLFSFLSFGQEQRVGSEIVNSKKMNQGVTYHSTISSPDSYTVIKNIHNVAITEEQLKEMNKYRDYEKSIEWQITSDLIVLLKPFEK